MSVSNMETDERPVNDTICKQLTQKPYCRLKHALDFVAACLALIVFGPMMLLTAVAVLLDSGWPVIFCQERVGRYEKTFKMYKFRTMKTGTPMMSTEDMQKQGQVPYTRLGPLLRRTNVDEFPQLFNIIKGEMSFIGPRPALLSQDDINSMRKLCGADSIRPGLTGLAQATGRDDLDSATKVARDHEYLRNMSLAFDARIWAMTFKAVLTGEGNK